MVSSCKAAPRSDSTADLFARVKTWGNVRPVDPKTERSVVAPFVKPVRKQRRARR